MFPSSDALLDRRVIRWRERPGQRRRRQRAEQGEQPLKQHACQTVIVAVDIGGTVFKCFLP